MMDQKENINFTHASFYKQFLQKFIQVFCRCSHQIQSVTISLHIQYTVYPILSAHC